MTKPAAASRLPGSRGITASPTGEFRRLDTAPDLAALCARLASANIRMVHEDSRRFAFFDDYDRQLWRNGLALAATARRWSLRDASGELAACPRKPGKAIRFWQEFPPGTLQDLLRPRLGVRALLPCGQADWSHAALEVRDEEQKLVARLTLDRLAFDSGEVAAVLGMMPLRGYEEEIERIRAPLSGWLAETVDDAGLFTLLRLDGRLTPAPAAAFRLDPAMPAETALRGRCMLLLREARQLESHIITDTDTEFLHQYRVLLRKARSQLKLLHDVLPPEVFVPALAALGDAAAQTHVLRDLDVFLLDSDAWRQQLPPEHGIGFQHLHARILRDRRQAWQALVRHLASPRYAAALDDVLALLAEYPRATTPEAQIPVSRLAGARLGRHARKLVRLATPLGPSSPDAEIHALRIEFKKLRYLLELFGDLAPPRKLGALVKELKELQDILGEFNDASVQRVFLLACLRTRPLDVDATAAIHGLIAVLHQRQLALRPRALTAIAAFGATDAEQRLRRLFPRPARKKDVIPITKNTTTTEGS